MKKIKLFFVFCAFVCTMTSCFDNIESQTTPQLYFGNLFVNPQFVGDTLVSAKDTLADHYNKELGLVYLDTLQLGDTLMFPAAFTSDMNNLISIMATYDTVNVQLWFGIDPEKEEIKKALAAGSKPEKGILMFNPMYHFVSFPIYIVPNKVGSFPIKIAVTSDSKYSSNHSIFTLPVK